ncbi:MAG TPA: response regulator, partial [Polyangiales bacterium]|nr:response regulator [Polyangiales bacterium]
DLILMDIQMPLMNGIDAARELRKRDISLAIFAFTGAPDAIGEARHLFTALLAKPMRLKAVRGAGGPFQSAAQALTDI